MKAIHNILIVLFCALFTIACDEDTEYVESREPGSIKVLDIENNTIQVHTSEAYQVQLSVLPEDAEITEPVKYAYNSADKDIFTVSADGLVSGVSPGKSVLTIISTNYPDLKTLVMVDVTDRVYAVTSVEIDDKFKDYPMAVGSTLDFSRLVTVKPDNATNPKLSYTSSTPDVVSVTEEGVAEALQLGEATVTIATTDGSNVKVECKITVKEIKYIPLDRAGWIVSVSHDLPRDAAISNSPESLIDGEVKTCLSMVKPGKSYDGIKVPEQDQVFFIIDMQQENDFDYFEIKHRTSNANEYLRPYAYTVEGSNNGTDFVPVLTDVEGKKSLSEFKIDIPLVVKFRYIKVIYSQWDTKNGSTVQLAEFYVGKKEL